MHVELIEEKMNNEHGYSDSITFDLPLDIKLTLMILEVPLKLESYINT